jgi:hypothetical protein
MEKFCKSCGMPMDKPEDFANNDTNSNYCYYCGERKDHEQEPYGRSDIIEKEEYYKKKEKKLKKKTKKKPALKKKTIKKKTKKKRK